MPISTRQFSVINLYGWSFEVYVALMSDSEGHIEYDNLTDAAYNEILLSYHISYTERPTNDFINQQLPEVYVNYSLLRVSSPYWDFFKKSFLATN